MIQIDLPIVPPTATAQQKGVFVRNGRAHFFTKKKVREADNFMSGLLLPYRPGSPIETPVMISVRFTFPFRKSERRAVVKAGARIPHTSRPDLDNLEKGLLDTMTRLGFWTDDSLIAVKHSAKAWGPEPSVRITIEDASGMID